MFGRSILTLAFGAAFIVTACGSGSSEGAAQGAVSQDQYCEQLASAMCEGADACCSRPEFGAAGCKAEAVNDCYFGHASDVKPEHFDAQRAAKVVNGIREATRTCGFWAMPKRSDILKVYHPALGEPCTEWEYGPEANFICPESAYCSYSESADTSICTSKAKEGESCENDIPCADGLLCRRGNDDRYACIKGLAKGAACGASGGCLEGLSCIATSPTTAECQPPLKVGATCFSYDACESQFCAPGNDPSVGKCKACVTNADCGDFTCVNGTCSTYGPPKKDGEPCRDSDQCKSGQCFQERCGLPTGDAVFCFDPSKL